MKQTALHSILKHFRTRCAPALAIAVIAACGGGGGGGGGGAPEPTVAAVNINPLAGNLQDLMVTLTGTNLAAGLSVTSPQCTTLTRSTTAPNASDAGTAYYRCATTATAPSTVTVTAARSSDGAALSTGSFTLGALTTVTQALAGEGAVAAADPLPEVPGKAKFGQLTTITVTGANVNQGLDVSSSSCSQMSLSTSPPWVSSATQAYYRCKAERASGLTQAVVARASDLTDVLASPLFIIPTPQVTLKMTRGTGTSAVPLGNVVITLAPSETPQTVNNFLGYVNAGFYNGTIFELIAKTLAPAPTPTLMLGGSFLPTSGSPPPQRKATNAPIALEVSRGLTNLQWTVGMDQPTGSADSATSGFYINLVDNPQLDPGLGSAGFAVFGNIDNDAASGRAVLTQMANSSCAVAAQFSECLASPNLVIESAVQTR